MYSSLPASWLITVSMYRKKTYICAQQKEHFMVHLLTQLYFYSQYRPLYIKHTIYCPYFSKKAISLNENNWLLFAVVWILFITSIWWSTGQSCHVLMRQTSINKFQKLFLCCQTLPSPPHIDLHQEGFAGIWSSIFMYASFSQLEKRKEREKGQTNDKLPWIYSFLSDHHSQ